MHIHGVTSQVPGASSPILKLNTDGSLALSGATGGVTSLPGAASTEVVNTQDYPRSTKTLTRGSVSFNASGDTALISATAAQTGRLHRLFLVFTSATNVKFRDGTTDLTGVMPIAAGGTLVLDYSQEPWFVTTANAALNINLSAAAQCSGWVEYLKS